MVGCLPNMYKDLSVVPSTVKHPECGRKLWEKFSRTISEIKELWDTNNMLIIREHV